MTSVIIRYRGQPLVVQSFPEEEKHDVYVSLTDTRVSHRMRIQALQAARELVDSTIDTIPNEARA